LEARTTNRAERAANRALSSCAAQPAIIHDRVQPPFDARYDLSNAALSLQSRTGALCYRPPGAAECNWVTPLADGQPALKGGTIVGALLAGDVLAVHVERARAPGLFFISLSTSRVVGCFCFGDGPPGNSFALSRNGQRFARLLDDRRLEVRDVPGIYPPILVTSQENVWIHFATLGRSCLFIREYEPDGPRFARHSCLIRWDQGRLDVVSNEAEASLAGLGGTVAVSRSLSPQVLGPGHDRNRFVQFIEHKGARVLIDRYNHLAVLGPNGNPTCMIYMTGNEVAAWLPDGTRYGPRRLIGGDPTPGARERIAVALARAIPDEGSSS
jgi:hypothetical protein